MAGHNKTGRSNKEAKHLRIYSHTFESEAYRSLTPAARAVFAELESTFNGVNNGSIGMGARRLAERCNINKDTAGRALTELAMKGFIRLAKRGAFHRKDRQQSEWILTTHSTESENASHDYKNWTPGKDMRPGAVERKSSVPSFRTDGPSVSDSTVRNQGHPTLKVALVSDRGAA